MAAELLVVGHTKPFARPAWQIRRLLGEDPGRWLTLEPQEQQPAEIDAGPDWVRWSSLWPDRPNDEILVEVTADSLGSRLRWNLYSAASDRPDDDVLRERRHRLNFLLNEQLRAFVEELD